MPTDVDVSTLTLVPPNRLGDLLAEARTAKGLTTAELARTSSVRFSASALDEIESGGRTLNDVELAALYDVETGELVPVRTTLVIDLDGGTMSVGTRQERTVDTSSTDDVLIRYLSLVTTLRSLQPGTAVPLRQVDVEVLAEALSVERAEVTSRLSSLMSDPDNRVADRARRLRRRRVVPAAGILVAATAVGVLLFVRSDDQVQSKTVSQTGGSFVEAPGESTGLIPPQVVEAGPDGLTTLIPPQEFDGPDGLTGLIPPEIVENDG